MTMSAHNYLPVVRRLSSAHSAFGALLPPDVNATLKVFGFAAGRRPSSRNRSTDQSAVVGVVTQPLTLPECTKPGSVSSRQRWINAHDWETLTSPQPRG
jgi:hypothetical protein